jgi:hypothetical protein
VVTMCHHGSVFSCRATNKALRKQKGKQKPVVLSRHYVKQVLLKTRCHLSKMLQDAPFNAHSTHGP